MLVLRGGDEHPVSAVNRRPEAGYRLWAFPNVEVLVIKRDRREVESFDGHLVGCDLGSGS